MGSSPCGDVNWNHGNVLLISSIIGSSPCGDMNWNIKQVPGFGIPILFVSLRRRELKYTGVVVPDNGLPVRLLAETWVEMYRAILLALDHHSSSPQGDVNWNSGLLEIIILHTDSSPCGDVNWNSTISCFSFQYTGSSPKGDVSWNNYLGLLFFLFFRSSPCGDVNWNIAVVHIDGKIHGIE